MTRTLMIAFGCASIAGSAFAQPPAPSPEMKALHEAVLKNCAADQEKFCHGLEGREGHNCMEKNIPNATKACQDAIARMPQPKPKPPG